MFKERYCLLFPCHASLNPFAKRFPGSPGPPDTMWFRFLALSIVAFAGTMTFLLVRVVYFPEFDRLPKVDPEHVMELFLDNHDVTDLYIYRDGLAVGEINMMPSRDQDGSGKVELGFTAEGVVELPNLPRQRLTWRGRIHLGPAPARKLERVELRVNFRKPNVAVSMQIDPVSFDFHYMVSQDGVVVTDSRTDPDAIGVAQVQLLMAAWGIDLSGRKAEPAVWEARRGTLDIAGHRAGAYFVVIDIPGAGEIRLSFSEAGEMLELKSPLGYEVLAPALRLPPKPLPYMK